MLRIVSVIGLSLLSVFLLSEPGDLANHLTTPAAQRNQILIDAERIDRINEHLRATDTRIDELTKSQMVQNSQLAVVVYQLGDLSASFHWIIGLLGTLLIGFIIRQVYDVVTK